MNCLIGIFVWICCEIAVACFGLYCYKTYYKASLKHRLEYVDLYFFCGTFYTKTGISISRAFIPIFSCFEKRYVGFGFRGCRVLVFNERLDLLVCLMEESRHKLGIKYDVGAGGYIKTGDDETNCAYDEFEEELNIKHEDVKTSFSLVNVLTPSEGYHCIVYVYTVVVNSSCINELKSPDNTYEGFLWVSMDNFVSYKNMIKNDPYKCVYSKEVEQKLNEYKMYFLKN